jgi:hypothetical protein
MKGQLNAATPAEYIAQLTEPRHSEIAALDALICRLAPQLESFIQIGILAYGRYRRRYAGGREAEWPRIGIASNQNYISLYVGPADGDLAGQFQKLLPKARIGKGCVRFKRLSDLDPAALEKLILAGSRELPAD